MKKMSLIMAGLMLVAAVVSCKKPDNGGKQKEDPVEVPQNPSERTDEATGNVIAEWSANPAATGYEVELEGTELGGATHTNSYTFEKEDLEYDTGYRWRVRTFAGSNASEWIEWRTFTTAKRPANSLWPGTWRATQDGVDFTATVTMAGVNIDLTDLLPVNLSDLPLLPVGDLDLVLAPVDGNDKKVLLSPGNLGALLPVGIQGAELTVESGNRLNGDFGGMEAQRFPLTDISPDGIPLSSIPGFSQIAENLPIGGDLIANLNITAISVTVNSMSVTGQMTDATGTKADITLSADSAIGIETNATGLTAIAVNFLLGSMPLSVSLDIDCTKVE